MASAQTSCLDPAIAWYAQTCARFARAQTSCFRSDQFCHAGQLQDLQGVTIPRDVTWPTAGWPNWLVIFFDWDILLLNKNWTNTVSTGVALCTSFFPCSLYIRGAPEGAIDVTGSGYISCLASSGCFQVVVEGVVFSCRERDNTISVFKIQGSTLNVSSTSFIGCSSETDGGAIQSYDMANVSIVSCHFQDIQSNGFGGAIAAFGSNMVIIDSGFTNCSSLSGGGAVWASAFQGCYGSTEPSSTILHIESCLFNGCTTSGFGGAVFANAAAATPSNEALDVTIQGTMFVKCRAGGDGGALQISGSQVVALVKSARFYYCTSESSGGAISASDYSSIALIGCGINRSVANGLGGGAIHIAQSFFLSYNVSIRHNSAPFGGGGVLFWQLSVRPASHGCPLGTINANVTCPLAISSSVPSKCIVGTCVQCPAGTYQPNQNGSECVSCQFGSFSGVVGATTCSSCPLGTFSNIVGANSSGFCEKCSPGTFADSQGLSSCFSCSDGKYTSVPGSLSCTSCKVGFYSGYNAAWCSACISGIYTGPAYLSQQSAFKFSQCPPQTAENGTIGRLSRDGNYSREWMFWVLAPTNASNIYLEFVTFNTTQGHGFVDLYACSNISCLSYSSYELSSISGSILPVSITCPSGVMLIIWRSDGSTKMGRWSATYQSNKFSGRRILSDIFENKPKDIVTNDLYLQPAGMRRSGYAQVDLDGQSGQSTANVQKRLVVAAQTRPTKVNVAVKKTSVITLESVSAAKTSRTYGVSSPRYISATSMTNLLESPSDLCGKDNSAFFGACIASGYETLSISLTMDAIYAGVPFNLTVTKLDAYGNTILSDSTSVLQVVVGSSDEQGPAAIIGSSLAQLTHGMAKLQFAVQPTFSFISVQNESALLSGACSFYMDGSDSEAGGDMVSDIIPLNVQQGPEVCPPGYILLPDTSQQVATKGPAVCQLCKPGTYSILPLARVPGSGMTPSCIDCPAAGICTKGGDEVKFEVGNWTAIDGMYILTECPEGFQLINSTTGTSKGEFSNTAQECKACLPEQYILNPNTDTCQNCPPGLICSGTSKVVPAINSTWVRYDSIYKLVGCPSGYSILSTGVSGAFDATIQQCSPCAKGEECVTPPCTVCVPCGPGFYKASASVDACEACPADTYNTELGGQTLSACQRCQIYSSTQGRVGQTSQAACLCNLGYYSARTVYSFTCAVCPSGAICSDGSCALLKGSSLACSGGEQLVGDWRVDNSSGLYVLEGCPAGYYLNAEQCQLCPSLYYCTGGILPSTPCASGQFSNPGAISKQNCSFAVFVVLIINLPILRPFFTDQTSLRFQSAVANSAGTDSNHVTVDIIQSGNDPTTTEVTSRIATTDAQSAAALVIRLNSMTILAGFNSNGFEGATLLSVQVTACVPGFELQSQPPPSTCQPCAANYFCTGGTAARTPCPDGGFSAPATNMSSACTQAAVVLVVDFAVQLSNFTTSIQSTFLHILASSAGVSLNQVAIISISAARRAIEVAQSVQVTSQISADNQATAQAISANINPSLLNANFKAQNLPVSSSISIAVQSAVPDTGSGGSISLPAVIGGCIGGFVFFLGIGIFGYYLVKTIVKQRADNALFDAFKKAKAGDPASANHLPKKLQKHFSAESVLGKGAYGCVVRAKKKGTNESVAIKVVLPEKGTFDERQLRQLKREENVLRLFTATKCEHAVMLAGLWAVEIRNDMCWFIMDLLDGENMEDVIHPNYTMQMGKSSVSECDNNIKERPEDYAVSDLECIKAARCVLAALKVMHAEGVVHRDVKPANIVRSKVLGAAGRWDGRTYSYKLVDFGSALGVDETVAKEAMMTLVGNRAGAAGTPPYMSPEMFKEPERASYPTDVWSLGVTMFEMVTGQLPFYSESDLLWSFAIAGNMDEYAPNVLDILSENRRSIFDNNLAKAIAKALEKKVAYRYSSADEMHEAVYRCLIARGEGCYSAFISYRVASEAPLARIIFDELNHSVTPGGHRVTVYWDAHRLVKGEDWEDGFGVGLFNSLCFLPLLSYGSTAPLAALPNDAALAEGWEGMPVGRKRLQGAESDPEDNFLKEMLIAAVLLDLQRAAEEAGGLSSEGLGRLQLAYPILIGRQQPLGHPDYPKMGSFFQVIGGGGSFPETPSPPTARAVANFLTERAGLNNEVASQVEKLTIDSVVKAMTQLQGCQLWDHPQVLVYFQASILRTLVQLHVLTWWIVALSAGTSGGSTDQRTI